MNHIYRIVWNASLSLWTVASETAKGRSKSSSSGKKRLAAVLVLASPLALANPTGGTVSAGSGTIAQSGAITTITQSSQNLAIDWSSFSVGAKETVQFFQPNALAIALNRITGSTPTSMLGHLSANGQVFILNPNGVLFGRNAQVNVGGLLASTLNLSNADLMAGKISLTGNSTASVINQGSLTSSSGGYVALIGGRVSNQGSIQSQQGSALLAAGSQVTVNLNNGSLIGYKVDQGTLNALAENRQLIQADGGQVILTAQAANAIGSAVVNNTGIIEARTVQNKNGTILLLGDISRGTVNAGGTLDASAPTGGNGGFIETSAAKVKIAEGTRVTTLAGNSTDSSTAGGTTHGSSGTWLIDPKDFTIAASGGDITGTTLSNNLGSGNVTIQSTLGATNGPGDVNVNEVVNWSANTLTLSAQNNININANMNGSGTAKLALQYGQSAVNNGNTRDYYLASGVQVNLPAGNNLTTKLGSNGNAVIFTVITDLGTANSNSSTNLQGMRGNLSRNYALGANIDASATTTWNAGQGFTPVGDFATYYTGNFTGLGHSVSNLYINRPNSQVTGLFGATLSSFLRSVKVENVNITGGSIGGYTGTLAGYASVGSLYDAFSSGSVSGSYYVGGLVGLLSSSNLSYGLGSSVAVFGYNTNVGGLIGVLYSNLTNSYATGPVTGAENVGGLIGKVYVTATDLSLTNSWASGAVGSPNANSGIGGLVGLVQISNAYYRSFVFDNTWASGVVNAPASFEVGGLVGSAPILTNIVNSHATGSVLGSSYVGGLAGDIRDVSNSWATGNVIASQQGVGGLVGSARNISYSWATGNVSSGGSVVGGLAGGARNIIYSWASGSVTSTGLNTYEVNPGSSVGGLVGTARTVYFSHASGNVQSTGDMVGGLVGSINSSGQVFFSYALGNVTSTGNQAGGLVGYTDGQILLGFATGNVSAHEAVGGLVGATDYLIDSSYATGNVYASGVDAGGLVGRIGGSSSPSTGGIRWSYSSGSVSGAGNVGGLVGRNDVTYDYYWYTQDSYWNTTSSGTNIGVGYGVQTGTAGLTSTQMQQQSSFSGFDFSSSGDWRIYEGHTTPLLRTFLTPLTITASNVTKVYDATSAGLTNVTYSVPSASGSANLIGFNTPYGNVTKDNVGTYAADIWSNQLGYDITLIGGGLTVTPASLSVTGLSATSKVYDATRTAALTGASISPLGSDSVSLNGPSTGLFNDKNVGTGKTVTFGSFSISGADAGNYTLQQPGAVTADISKAAISVTGLAGVDRVYDATTSASLAGTATISAFSGDVISLGGTGIGSFADKNVGTGKAVTVTGYTISGDDAGNYTLVQPNGLTANITPATLQVTGIAASNRVYDTTRNATLTGTAGISAFSGDVVSLGGAGVGSFADKNVGTGKAVTVTGYTIFGDDAGNYTLVQPSGLTANITAASLQITGVSAVSRSYNATTSASLAGTASISALSGDTVTLAGTGVGSFADKNVGTGKAVTVTGYTISGDDAGNYALVQPTGLTASISAANLQITGASAVNRTYSGTTSVAIAGATISPFGSDDVSLSGGVGTVADKNVGTGKAVTVSGYSLTGADAGNYNLLLPTGLTVNISKAPLTITPTAISTTYSGVAFSGGNGVSYSGFVNGETASVLGGSLNYLGTSQGAVNAGTYGLRASGLTSSNYAITNALGTLTINKAPLLVTALDASKTYNGLAYSGGNGVTYSGLVNGESSSVLGGSLVYSGSAQGAVNAGSYLIKVSGLTSGNYVITYSVGKLIVNKAILTVTANDFTKKYDGVAFFGGAGATYSGFVNGEGTGVLGGSLIYGGDSQGATAAGTYQILLSGLNAANYTIVYKSGKLKIKGSSAP